MSEGPGRTRTALTREEDRLARRRALVPRISYPEGLPVVERREDIAVAIRDHQVVVIADELGVELGGAVGYQVRFAATRRGTRSSRS